MRLGVGGDARRDQRLDGHRVERRAVGDQHLAQRGAADHADAPHEPRLVDVAARHHDGRRPRTASSEHRGQHARDRTQPTVERELADMHHARDGRGVDGSCRGERGDRDAEVEARPVLRHGRRREVDGDLAGGQVASGVGGRSAHPVFRLAERGVGQADDGEGGQTVGQVGLDLDERTIDAVQGDGEGAGHSHQLTARR